MIHEMFSIYQQPNADVAQSQGSVRKDPTLRDVTSSTGSDRILMEITRALG